MKDSIMVRVSVSVKDALFDLKQHPRETYEDVIARLIAESRVIK